jgi:hypothetical protein
LTDAASVQRFHRGNMFRTCLFHDPDRTLNVTVREIGYQLAEMAVVASSVLILDYHFAQIGLGNEVDPEVAGAYFTLSIVETKPKDLVEFGDVSPEPRRKVSIFFPPYSLNWDRFDSSN